MFTKVKLRKRQLEDAGTEDKAQVKKSSQDENHHDPDSILAKLHILDAASPPKTRKASSSSQLKHHQGVPLERDFFEESLSLWQSILIETNFDTRPMLDSSMSSLRDIHHCGDHREIDRKVNTSLPQQSLQPLWKYPPVKEMVCFSKGGTGSNRLTFPSSSSSNRSLLTELKGVLLRASNETSKQNATISTSIASTEDLGKSLFLKWQTILFRTFDEFVSHSSLSNHSNDSQIQHTIVPKFYILSPALLESQLIELKANGPNKTTVSIQQQYSFQSIVFYHNQETSIGEEETVRCCIYGASMSLLKKLSQWMINSTGKDKVFVVETVMNNTKSAVALQAQSTAALTAKKKIGENILIIGKNNINIVIHCLLEEVLFSIIQSSIQDGIGRELPCIISNREISDGMSIPIHCKILQYENNNDCKERVSQLLSSSLQVVDIPKDIQQQSTDIEAKKTTNRLRINGLIDKSILQYILYRLDYCLKIKINHDNSMTQSLVSENNMLRGFRSFVEFDKKRRHNDLLALENRKKQEQSIKNDMAISFASSTPTPVQFLNPMNVIVAKQPVKPSQPKTSPIVVETIESPYYRLILVPMNPSKGIDLWISTKVDSLVGIHKPTVSVNQSHFLIPESEDFDEGMSQPVNNISLSSHHDLHWTMEDNILRGYNSKQLSVSATPLTEWLAKEAQFSEDYIVLEPIKQYSAFVENKLF